MVGENEPTVGEWLDLFEIDPRRAMETAWSSCVSSGDGEADGEVLLRLVEMEAAAARRFDPGSPLGLLWAGIRRNIAREECRRGSRARTLPDWSSIPSANREGAPATSEAMEGEGVPARTPLTSCQSVVIKEVLRGRHLPEVARDLGISLGSVVDRLARAIRNLDGSAARTGARGRDFNARQSRGSRKWARRSVSRPQPPLSPSCRALLDEYSAGVPLKEIARRRGISKEAVRSRKGRLRRKFPVDG